MLFFTVTIADDSDDDDLPPAFQINKQNVGVDVSMSNTTTNSFQHYDSYVSLIDDDDDYEDPDFLAAIEASISDQQQISDNTNLEDDVEDILKQFVSENIQTTSTLGTEEDMVKITISRKYVYSSTLRALQRPSFSFVKPVKVTFSGEAAVDTGGPRREYMRLLMAAVGESAVFSGGWLSHDLSLLNTKQYELAGKLVVWSILQGGPGPRCLSEEVFNLLNGFPSNKKFLIQIVADQDLKIILNEIESASTKVDFLEVIAKHSDAVAAYGYSAIFGSKFSDKGSITECLIKQHFIFGVHAEIQQFRDGLNSIGMYIGYGDAVRLHVRGWG